MFAVLGLHRDMSWFTPAELPENKYYLFGKEGCKQPGRGNGCCLGRIPIVQEVSVKMVIKELQYFE